MGMYNEVFKCCPICDGNGYAQIPQIVAGFGGFNLDNPKSIADQLVIEDCILLRKYLQNLWFTCENEKCKYSFQLTSRDDESEKIKILTSFL